MRIILTGASGFVGGEVLKQLLANPEATEVCCLVRRSLAVKSSKLRQIVLKDFLLYSAELSRELATFDGCIWALGGKASNIDAVEFEKMTTGFTLSLALSIVPQLSKPFQFCYLSGMGADPTESAFLPWKKLTRHMKGRTERLLKSLSEENSKFYVTAFPPAGILPTETHALVSLFLSPIAIRMDLLSRKLISVALSDRKIPFQILSNSQIKSSSEN